MYNPTWKLGFFVFLLFLFLSPVLATESLCGPHPVLGPTEYCSFAPFIKVGKDDAIITLSWDALGSGMQGVPTPSMVGGYYFYFRDGKLYYLGSTTGAEELFYTFYRGLWYLSDGRAIDPEKPCVTNNVMIPEEIRNELCSCGNVSITSPSYPVEFNGSKLHVSNGRVSYTIKVPDNMTLHLPSNTTLRAVFLGEGALIYIQPKNPFVPLDWGNVTVLYYDGSSLWRLNLTRGLEKELPTCPVASGVGYLEFYPMLFAGLVLVLVLAYRRVRR
ncbi:hypothetical protein A0127_10210 (plasmid) [Thermococcus peptonophilus]|uniref:Uncharacterized protein n=2 Tax=Thermococcus peptonophilus TaxID=53952 RepID=A0A142CXU6_9EURY|nr:hypothetical protein A0127_10210 [Thermococcus peptonophilus]